MSISQNFPATWPSLTLDFANSKTLDPRVTFTRASTGTYVGADGLIKIASTNQARFDHDPATGESLGLLIEESRTNLLQHSIPNNTNWDNNGSNLSINNSISPDGINNATLFTGTGTNTSAHFILRNQSVTSGTVYTQTFFVKAGTTEFVQIAPSTGFNSRYANFQLTGDGVVGNYDTPVPPTIQKYPNGWYRLRVTETAASTTTTGRMALVSIDSLTSARIPLSEPRTFYVWGAQLEVGSFPTSYIPTSGSQVTRSQDYMALTGTNFSSWQNPSQGTYVMTIKNNSTNTLGLPSPLRTNSLFLFFGTLYFTKNTTSNVQLGTNGMTTTYRNWAFYHDGPNGYGMCMDGQTPLNASNPIGTSDSYLIANDVQGETSFYLKKLRYYPTLISNAELRTLTK